MTPNQVTADQPVTMRLEDLSDWVGRDLGASGWIEVDQDLVNRFADLTDDYNWVHVDLEKAKAEIGGTIAHGLLVLSLMPRMLRDIYRVSGVGRSLNYGYDRLRYTAPTPVGSKVRLKMTLKEVSDQGAGRRVTFGIAIECDATDRPVLVGDWIVILFPRARPAD